MSSKRRVIFDILILGLYLRSIAVSSVVVNDKGASVVNHWLPYIRTTRFFLRSTYFRCWMLDVHHRHPDQVQEQC